MTGVRGASLEVPHGLAENPPCSACVSRSLAQVEPWDEILPQAQSRGGTPIGERALQSARRIERCGGYGPALIGVPLPFLLSYIVAQSADREATGNHRRHSLAKIGAESGEFLPSDDDSGANRIARTMRLVIAGLDPAIPIMVARPCQFNRDGRNKSGHDTIAV